MVSALAAYIANLLLVRYQEVCIVLDCLLMSKARPNDAHTNASQWTRYVSITSIMTHSVVNRRSQCFKQLQVLSFHDIINGF